MGIKDILGLGKPRAVGGVGGGAPHAVGAMVEGGPERILQALPEGIVIVDDSGAVLGSNPAAAELAGAPLAAAELAGAPLAAAAGRKFWEAAPILETFRRRFEEGVLDGRKVAGRVETSAAGEERFLNVAIVPLDHGGALIRIDDVTESAKKDEHLRQAQKMDTIGNLAAGLAHDFNNVIGGIEGTISSIEFSLANAKTLDGLRAEIADDLEVVKDAIRNGGDMVEQLMSISRRKETDFAAVDLNEIVRKVAGIGARTFGRELELEVSYAEGEAMIEGYGTQLEQALLNLCVNASHAMTIMRQPGDTKTGGNLTISLALISVGVNISSLFPDAAEGEHWLVTVSDTGVGMTRELVAKIFDPFFTTKEKGAGTGLGLSMVYNIVRQHKGFIEVYSEPGQGTTFMVFLPVSARRVPIKGK